MLKTTGAHLLKFEAMKEAASRNINTMDDLREVIRDMHGAYMHFRESEVQVMFFGVFPTPIMWIAAEYAKDQSQYGSGLWGAHLYSAWNVCRSQESGERTFSHNGFMYVGSIDFRFAKRAINE